MKTKKTLLVGNFGARNVGDEIILWTALQEHKESIVMTADSDFTVRFLNIPNDKNIYIPSFPTGIRSLFRFIFNKKSREKILKPLRENDITKVVFPGGGLFAIKFRAYFIWFITFIWIRRYLPTAEIIFEHQGIDMTNSKLKNKILTYVFGNSNNISVRDNLSHQSLKKLDIDSVHDYDRVEKFLQKSNIPRGERKNLVLINACRPNLAKFSAIATPERMPQGTSCAFICFEPADARYIPTGFRGQIIFPETVADVFKIFQRSHTAIGQRLHFLILAQYFCGSDATFTLEKPYAEKVQSFVTKYKINSL